MDIEKFINDTVDELKSNIERYERYLSVVCITRANHVIASKESHVFYTPEFESNKTTGKVEFFCNPLDATAFAKEDADNLAPKIKNGLGTYTCKSMSLCEAVEQSLARDTRQLETYKKAQERM